MARVYKIKTCLRCGGEYRPTVGSQKYCMNCRPEIEIAYSRSSHERRHEKELMEGKIYRTSHCEKRAAYAAEYSPVYCLAHSAQAGARVKAWNKLHPNQRKIQHGMGRAKRRILGFNPLNSPFVGCEGHHINKSDVIYLPQKLHRSVSHNQWTGRGMVEINALAGKYLTEDWT